MQANIFKITKAGASDKPDAQTVIYFKGCPLRCAWCSNPRTRNRPTQILWDNKRCLYCRLCAVKCPSGSLHFQHNTLKFDSKTCTVCRNCIRSCPPHMLHFVGKMMALDEVMEIILQNHAAAGSEGGVTLSGGDAILQPHFASELLRRCHEHSIRTTVETTGYANTLDFSRLISHTDLLRLDLKHYDERKHIQYTGVSNQSILANLDFALLMRLSVVARISVIPGINNALSDAREFARLLLAHQVKDVELLHYSQLGEKKYETFQLPAMLVQNETASPVNLTEYASVMREYGLNVQILPQ